MRGIVLFIALAVGGALVAHAQNPYLPLWEHLPDGEPRVFEDPDRPGRYRLYIYGSHDTHFTEYCGVDVRAWSAPIEDLTNWRDEGAIFTYYIDGRWDTMYAPDIVELRDSRGVREFWLYPHSRGAGREAMVARGNRPTGPFVPVNLTHDGRTTLPGSVMGFDPSVYVESANDLIAHPDGFRAWGYWGYQRSQAAELNAQTMWSARRGTEVIPYFMPSSDRAGQIIDPIGTHYPYLYPSEDPAKFGFYEASSIRRVGNKYVMIYSGYSGPEYGLPWSNSTLRYAYGDSPLGPWRSGGVLVDSRAPMPSLDGKHLIATGTDHNTHGSIELVGTQWYVFYHRSPRDYGFARQPMVAPIWIDCDEHSVETGGAVRITAYDPINGHWAASSQKGDLYRGAEVTSEGFQIYGLPPYAYYPAGIACYMSNPETQSDSWDSWDNSAPINAMRRGHIVGYKYFGFGGLKRTEKGLPPFEGTSPENDTQFSVWLRTRTMRSFTMEVWIDGPSASAPLKGRKIGTIDVLTGPRGAISQFSIDVSRHVDIAQGKRAIYLVADGPAGVDLCDLIGLGFHKKREPLERPIPPTVNIFADGKAVELPKLPVRTTSVNGISDVSIYDVNVRPGSIITTSAPEEVETRTTTTSVSFTYRGVTKTYRFR